MGRAIKHTNVKVDGQAGPLGKGVPMTKAAGPGGIAMPGAQQGSQIPGFKELMAKKLEAMKNNKSRLFRGKMLGKPGEKGQFYDRLKQKMGQKPGGGLFGGFSNRPQGATPKPIGGTVSNKPQEPTKSVFQSGGWSLGGPSGGALG